MHAIAHQMHRDKIGQHVREVDALELNESA